MKQLIHPFTLLNCERCESKIPWPNYSEARPKPIPEKMYLKRKFCSEECRRKDHSEKLTGEKCYWWKGGLPKCCDCGTTLSCYSRTRCRDCYKSFNKGRNHSGFKEQLTNYKYIHKVLRDTYGAPTECVFCHTKENLEWANKNGNYSRYKEDYIGLCKKCHRGYDASRRKSK